MLMVQCSRSGTEYDECRVGREHAMLEPNVVHCFRKECDQVIKIMRHTIAVNGSLFYLLRMLVQYLHNAYRLGEADMPQHLELAGH